MVTKNLYYSVFEGVKNIYEDLENIYEGLENIFDALENNFLPDCLCEDVDGTKFILEMQNCPQRYFFNRGFYYICRLVTRQGQIVPDWKTTVRLHSFNNTQTILSWKITYCILI